MSGWLALVAALLALAIPTAVRAAVSGSVSGCEFTPYLPFVLLAAILLRWWQAGAVALASVAVMGGILYQPSDHMLMSCFQSAAAIFLASSAGMIGLVMLTRRLVTGLVRRGRSEVDGGVVFSLENDEVWASWYGSEVPMRLGSQQRVEAMMEDFLAQVKFGKHLTDKCNGTGAPSSPGRP